jgi:peptide deformylase
VIVNPELTALDEATFATNEGCLSMPNVRGDLERFENVEVRYLDRDGEAHESTRRGLTAGTFQHEVDHLDGILFVDRMVDMSSLSTWAEFERHGKDDFVRRIEALVERVGS